jgi:transcriptional regulator NrdR family protein
MRCPACRANDVTCIASRHTKHSVKRRRRCNECEHRWTSYESTIDFPAEFAKLKALAADVKRRNRALEAELVRAVDALRKMRAQELKAY